MQVSLTDLASLGSFVSGMAVLVSLIFVFFQMRAVRKQSRQAQFHQMAAIRHSRTNRVVEIFLTCASPSVADAVSKGEWGDTDISPTELRQFRSYAMAIFNNAEDSFYQHKEGLLNDDAYSNFVFGLTETLSRPGIRAAWQSYAHGRNDAFGRSINKIIAQTPLSGRNDIVEQWNDDVAGVRLTSKLPKS